MNIVTRRILPPSAWQSVQHGLAFFLKRGDDHDISGVSHKSMLFLCVSINTSSARSGVLLSFAVVEQNDSWYPAVYLPPILSVERACTQVCAFRTLRCMYQILNHTGAYDSTCPRVSCPALALSPAQRICQLLYKAWPIGRVQC